MNVMEKTNLNTERRRKLREKTTIGIRHNCGDVFEDEYYDQEFSVNCQPDEIFINGLRYNEQYTKLYQDIVDLLHQILIDGSHLRYEDDGTGEFKEEYEWYEWLDNEASVLLDELGE